MRVSRAAGATGSSCWYASTPAPSATSRRRVDWYEQQRPGLGADLAEELEHALEAIAERPSAWPCCFPFAIGYVVHEDEIIVIAVAHLRRRPGYWLERVAGRR